MSTKAHLLSNSYACCKLPDKSYNIQYLFRFDYEIHYIPYRETERDTAGGTRRTALGSEKER